MSGVARFGQGGVGAMPTSMVNVVAGGTAFAMAALAAGAAMQNDLMRAGGPVFVNEKLRRFGRRPGGLGDQSNFSNNFLQPRARVAAHGQQKVVTEVGLITKPS